MSVKIKVFGVGGGGGNAINRMSHNNVEDIDFIAVNTDVQALNRMDKCSKLQIGIKETSGLGAGANPEVGRKAALEAQDDISNALENTDLAIVTVGLGGGTGTGAAPEISQIAKSKGILTIGVATLPFTYEGGKRKQYASKGLVNLQNSTDSIIVIANENLLSECDRNVGFYEAYKLVDDVLGSAVRAITSLILQPAEMRTDFADLQTTLGNAGKAMIGIGYGVGENRAIEAATNAITSPLLEYNNFDGADRIIVNVAGSESMSLIEMKNASEFITKSAKTNAEIICGLTIDPALGDKIKVTTIIAGLNDGPSSSSNNRMNTMVNNAGTPAFANY